MIAIDVTKKTLFERLYLVPGMATSEPWVNCPYAPTTPAVYYTIISRFSCNFFPRIAENLDIEVCKILYSGSYYWTHVVFVKHKIQILLHACSVTLRFLHSWRNCTERFFDDGGCLVRGFKLGERPEFWSRGHAVDTRMDTTVTVTQQVNLTNAVKQHGKTSKLKKKSFVRSLNLLCEILQTFPQALLPEYGKKKGHKHGHAPLLSWRLRRHPPRDGQQREEQSHCERLVRDPHAPARMLAAGWRAEQRLAGFSDGGDGHRCRRVWRRASLWRWSQWRPARRLSTLRLAPDALRRERNLGPKTAPETGRSCGNLPGAARARTEEGGRTPGWRVWHHCQGRARRVDGQDLACYDHACACTATLQQLSAMGCCVSSCGGGSSPRCACSLPEPSALKVHVALRGHRAQWRIKRDTGPLWLRIKRDSEPLCLCPLFRMYASPRDMVLRAITRHRVWWREGIDRG